MATAMELAFARSRGVYLEPTAPDGNPEDISHTIIVIIEKTRFTLRQLMDGVALPLSDIDPEILANALPFLDPGRRNYIEKDGKRFFQKPPRGRDKAMQPKLIEYIGYESHSHSIIRDTDRELVAVLKGEKDLFTTEAGTIKYMRNFLLRLLAQANTRLLLQEGKSDASAIIDQINAAFRGEGDPSGLESQARGYYEKMTQALGFIDLDHDIVRALSWEWKNRPIYRDHPYACRCWVIILCLFGLTKLFYRIR